MALLYTYTLLLYSIGVIILPYFKIIGRYAQNGRRRLHYFLFGLHASRDIFCIGNEFLLNSNLVHNMDTGCIFVYQKIKINRYLPIIVIIYIMFLFFAVWYSFVTFWCLRLTLFCLEFYETNVITI